MEKNLVTKKLLNSWNIQYVTSEKSHEKVTEKYIRMLLKTCWKKVETSQMSQGHNDIQKLYQAIVVLLVFDLNSFTQTNQSFILPFFLESFINI